MFIRTSKSAPSDEVSKNAKLLIRAGFVHKRMAGVYEYLPLGKIVLDNVVEVIRKEMNMIGGQEVSMTALQPKELWKKTERWNSEKIDVWFKTELSSGGEAGLAPTHEEPMTDMMTSFISSYNDLPAYPYQFQTKFRNELRAKSGLMRGREFLMKDLYDFSLNEDEHNKFYEKAKQAYIRVFEKLGLDNIVYPTFASGGIFSKFSEEFQMLSPVGEDKVYVHNSKKIAVNEEVWNDEVMEILGTSMDEFHEEKAIEVGNIFHLGTKYSKPLDLKYTDEKGQVNYPYMGSYGIGPSRLMGAIAEHFADEKGLIWPEIVAPAKVYLINIENDEEIIQKTEAIYNKLKENGIKVIWDNRSVRAGEKFADSELMGIPFRLVISKKLEDKIELKKRTNDETQNITLGKLFEVVK